MPEPALTGQSADTGWFGKLPCAGDFLCRRVPDTFRDPWDRWLQHGIALSRGLHGDAWADRFLTFPVWRFLLPAGQAGASGWCGVLMPSVDRVGRMFPLTLCTPLSAAPGLPLIDAHLDALERIGLDGLDGLPVEDFDAAVRAIAPMSALPADAVCGPDGLLALGAGVDGWRFDRPLPAMLADAAGRSVLACLGARALWWTAPAHGAPGLLRIVPMPLADGFLDLLIAADGEPPR